MEFFGETGFRYANYDTPLWARNNKAPARWHVPGDGATQYISLHPDGAWAELVRKEHLQTDEELALVRMMMWAVTLHQQNLVNYSTFAIAEEAGFPPDALVDDDHLRCQAEGKRLRDLKYAGVVCPSAAIPGVLNVAIFGRRFKSMWGQEPKTTSAMPACLVAVGSPPPGLADRVRYFATAPQPG
jgi:RES domain-containing protein